MSRVFWTVTGTAILTVTAVFLGFLIVINDAINHKP